MKRKYRNLILNLLAVISLIIWATIHPSFPIDPITDITYALSKGCVIVLVLLLVAKKFDEFYERRFAKPMRFTEHRFVKAKTRLLIVEFGLLILIFLYVWSMLNFHYTLSKLSATLIPIICVTFYILAIRRKSLQDMRIMYYMWAILFFLNAFVLLCRLPECDGSQEVLRIIWRIIFPGMVFLFLFGTGLNALRVIVQREKEQTQKSESNDAEVSGEDSESIKTGIKTKKKVR